MELHRAGGAAGWIQRDGLRSRRARTHPGSLWTSSLTWSTPTKAGSTSSRVMRALAVWGAPLHVEDLATKSLAAARTLGFRLRDELPTLAAGLGVSGGTVVTGNIGAANRYEYTAIGDPVNEAARLTEAPRSNRVAWSPTPPCSTARLLKSAAAGLRSTRSWSGEGRSRQGSLSPCPRPAVS